MRIEEAIKQKEFKNELQKVQINVLFTAAWLSQNTSSRLKPFGITWQQFNILRILRGQQGKPCTVKLLTERMIDKMSNASRLVDKLVNKDFVERKTCSQDRRRVDVFLTPAGLDLVNRASEFLEQELESRFSSNLTTHEAGELNRLLDKLRG